MVLELQDAVDFADRDDLTYAYMEAFYDDVTQQCLFPGMSKEQRLASLRERWPNIYGSLRNKYTKVVDSSTGKIVSFASWQFKNTDAGGPLRKISGWPEGLQAGPPPSTPEGLDDDFATDFSDRIEPIKEKYVGDKPHLYLKMMGTMPKYRGQGAGSLHVQWGIDVADSAGLLLWLEASPMSVAIYEKFGFQPVGTVVLKIDPKHGVSEYVHTLMLRESRKTPPLADEHLAPITGPNGGR